MRVIEKIPFYGEICEDELNGWPIVVHDTGVCVDAYICNNLAKALGYRHKWDLINSTIGARRYEELGKPKWAELVKHHLVWHNTTEVFYG